MVYNGIKNKGVINIFIRTDEVNINDKVIIKVPVITRVMDALSVHNVELRTSQEGNDYYLFYYIKGTCITNYSKDNFEELDKILPIDKVSIFVYEEGLGILPVSESYRY